MANNKNNADEFLVSTADFAFYVDDILACVGRTNLNATFEVSMQEQNINAGKGNKLVYSYKYGRELNVTLEAADWKLEFIACQTGSKITEGLTDIYKMGECVILTDGIGILNSTPIGDVAVELPNKTIVTVTPTSTSIDLTAFGLTNESVKVTYQFNKIARTMTIDAESTPMTGKLVLDATRFDNRKGKVGSVQIIVPSYQLSGNFSINFTPDGVASTSLEGRALAVQGDTCKDGSVYAYIKETKDDESDISVNEIVATPATINLDSSETSITSTISVIGLKGALYAPIELDNSDCTFVSDKTEFATVGANTGIVTPVATGIATITVTYQGKTDEVEVVVS